MTIFIFLALFFSLKKILILKRKKKVLENTKIITLKKGNLNRWMNLTKKERYNLSKKESASYLNKRKVLLEEIRKEYKRISKDNSK